MCTHTLPQVHLRTATVPMSQIDILLHGLAIPQPPSEKIS